MAQAPYTDGSTGELTGNASVGVVHGGTDLGYLAENVTIKLPVAIRNLKFAQNQMPVAVEIDEGEPPAVSGIIHQMVQSKAIKLFPHATDVGPGTSFGIDGSLGQIVTGSVTWVYFFHDISGLPKRLWFPKGIMTVDGDIPVGSGADMIGAPFTIVGTHDSSQSTGYQLWHWYWDESGAINTCTPSPADAAASQAVDVAVTLTFDEAIGDDFQVTSSDNPYIYLVKTDDGTNKITSISWNAAGTVATIAHANFATSTTYLLMVSGQLRAATGKLLAGDGVTAGTQQINYFGTTA